MIARRARWRSDLEFFEKPGFLHTQVVRQQLPLFFGGLAVAVNDLAQDALVDAYFASEKVLAHGASEKLQFKIRIHRFTSNCPLQWVLQGA